jgi:predicted NAD/FAD-dependent oxidoreductase
VRGAVTLKVAVIGAGIAGASCAHALSRSGHAVQVFDKSRGAGGRMATRRAEWVDRQGRSQLSRFDHGAPCFTAHEPSFQQFISDAIGQGWLTPWQPRLAPQSLPWPHAGPHYVAEPDMPALCRQLLDGIDARWSCEVSALHREHGLWVLEQGQGVAGKGFDAVVLAMPPIQAAALLEHHQMDWAARAAAVPMQPCWTLMGVTHDSTLPRAWDLARPASGALAWIMRNDARPGCDVVPGQTHWVVHASAHWSQSHLEQDAAQVQTELQAALAEYLGEPIDWLYATVHRWRYAMPDRSTDACADPCWWDAAQGLGVCGDFFAGSGVEGAWLSGRALASVIALLHGQ